MTVPCKPKVKLAVNFSLESDTMTTVEALSKTLEDARPDGRDIQQMLELLLDYLRKNKKGE